MSGLFSLGKEIINPMLGSLDDGQSVSRVTAIGQSGTSYGFQIHPIGTTYQEWPGVYIFSRLAPNGKWDAVYIGETDNFHRRLTSGLASHHKWQRVRAEGATHIGTLHVPGNLAARENIETDLRGAIRTPCNDQ